MKQYECMNVSQVTHKISELTNTKTTTDDWKDYCHLIKKSSGSDSVDYIGIDSNGKEYDCSVFIGYDKNTKSYLVWIEKEN